MPGLLPHARHNPRAARAARNIAEEGGFDVCASLAPGAHRVPPVRLAECGTPLYPLESSNLTE